MYNGRLLYDSPLLDERSTMPYGIYRSRSASVPAWRVSKMSAAIAADIFKCYSLIHHIISAEVITSAEGFHGILGYVKRGSNSGIALTLAAHIKDSFLL